MPHTQAGCPASIARALGLGLSLLVGLAACSGGESEDSPTDAGPGGPDAAAPDYADGDWLFEEDRILQIDIEMPAPDWDLLRFETRNILDIFGEQCGAGPAPTAFHYRSAKITIEGESFDTVGLRKKGFLGSLDTEKPSLKIKMDEYVAGQTMSGHKRFTLNNAKQDPSYVNQCLGYSLFAAAGVPAPRCNFAMVSVNGENLGLYVHVEEIKRPFLRKHFGTDTGNLYEGTLSDFRTDWTATFEKKTNKTITAQPDIDELTSALALDGSGLRAALEPLVDIEVFMRFWAMEVLVAHGDGYTGNSNNYYLYDSPVSDKFIFMPWGADNLFSDAPGSIQARRTRSLLPQKLFLHDESRAEYVATMTEILDTTWEDSAVLADIARMETLIRPLVSAEEEQAFNADLALLRATVSGREAEIRAQLGGLSAANAEPLMAPLCFEKTGSITGDFATTYGAAGTANMSVLIDGSPIVYTQQSSVAIPSNEDPQSATVAAFGDLADGSRTLLYLPVALTQMTPGTVAIDSGFLLFYPPASDEADRVEFTAGSIVFGEAGTTNGDAVAGTVDLDIWQSPFF